MYCPKCGTQNDDNAYKCTKCGIILQRKVPEKKSNTAVVALVIVGISIGVFMIISILAAIPAYRDYTLRSQIYELAFSFDSLTQAAIEYHADNGQFPEQSYSLDELVTVPQTYGTFSCLERTNDNNITYRFTFNNTISRVDGFTLDMQITYAPDAGYINEWLSTSTLPPKFMPVTKERKKARKR